jgi:UDP-N-acetylglucosamine 4,6-dehydratase
MIGEEDAPYTYEYDSYYKILPAINDWAKDPGRIKDGRKGPPEFVYRSDTNTEWMTREELRAWIDANRHKIGRI